MAKLMAERYPHITWWCPQLPPSPHKAAELIAQGTTSWPADGMAVIGSSLGGYYATWLSTKRGCKAILLNPAVNPARDLAHYIGEHTSWHEPNERIYFAPEFVDELKTLAVDTLPSTASVLALIAQGDEVLDWREMTARYPHAQQVIIEGGDHALTEFEIYLPQLLAFLNFPSED